MKQECWSSTAFWTLLLVAELFAWSGSAQTAQEGARDYANTIATLQTDFGDIEIKFLYDKAPRHVENFVDLSANGFYDGILFHRVVPGLLIQGGDPNTRTPETRSNVWGMGGNGKNRLKAEFNDTPHKRGIVSMARGPDTDSASSQFFIVLKDSEFLDHQYTAFGEVISGMDVVDKIAAVPLVGGFYPGQAPTFANMRPTDRPKEPVYIKKVLLSQAK